MRLRGGLGLYAFGAVALTALIASTARAQEPTPEQAARGRRIIQEAGALDERGAYALAAERWMDLYEEMTSAGLPRASVALSSAGESLSHIPGREAEAIAHLRQFLDESNALVASTDDPRVNERRSRAVTLIAELEARASSAEPEETEPEAPEEEPEPEPTPATGGLSPIGPVVLGLGGAVLVAGLITAAIGLVQNQEHIDRCPERVGCDLDMRSAVESTLTLGLAGDVLWIAGAAVAVAGLVLTLTLDPEGPAEDSAAIQLEGVPGGGMLSLVGRLP